MPMNNSPERIHFGLLPEPEGRSTSFVVSTVVNGTILAILLVVGMYARQAIRHQYEQTELIIPTNPAPPPKIKLPKPIKMPPPPKVAEVKLEAPKIVQPKLMPKPKAVQMQVKLTEPKFKTEKPRVVMQPQPKAAMAAAMPARVKVARASTKSVHLGSLVGVRPNSRAERPATIAAMGNPYGGEGAARHPHGVVGSAGIGNSTRRGSNAGMVGKVASAGFPGAATAGNGGNYGKVASAGIPTQATAEVAQQTDRKPQYTSLKVLSKPPVKYTAEARELKVQGNVVLRVTFMANGQVVVKRLVHGLGHGLDKEAMREARHIRFRPATRNGHPINLTTNIVITFQMA